MRFSSPTAATGFINAIVKRRAASGDDALEDMRDHPFGVLQYVRAHRDVSRAVLAEDAADALAIVHWLHGELDRNEHAIIRMARAAGLTWRQIGKPYGLTAQGAAQLYLRLEAQQQGGPRSEVHARRTLREQRRTAKKVRTAREIHEEAWLERHAAVIRASAAALVATLPDDEDTQEFLGSPASSLRDLMIWIEATSWELSPGQCEAAEQLAIAWRQSRR